MNLRETLVELVELKLKKKHSGKVETPDKIMKYSIQ